MPETRKVEFTGHNGDALAARLDLPNVTPRAYALFAHCFSCSKDIHAATRIAAGLVDKGIGVLRFDFTGLGASEGDFANTNFTSNVQDLVAAANWLESEHGAVDILIGHSLGGAAVVVAADALPSVRAVATIGAPSDADHVLHQFTPHLSDIAEKGSADILLAGRPFTIKQQFVEDVRGANVRNAASRLKRPLLVLHSPIDDVVGIDNATGLFMAAKHPKSFVSLDDADHLLSRKEDSRYAAEVIAAWASPYLAPSDAPTDDKETKRAKLAHDVVVQETGRGVFENSITVGDHSFLADEPENVGGGDVGPDPYELLGASLGACTSMTLRMYARHKGWPLDRVTVTVDHRKDHAEDCEACEVGKKVDIFDKTIRVEGALDDDQTSKLLEIADKCPVHRTLNAPVMIRSKLV